MNYKYLFTPEKIGSLEIKNRTIMAPMSAALGNPDGTMSDELLAYYTARAKGGVGMILTEYAFVTPEGRSSDHQISIADDSVIPGLQKLTETMHQYDCKIGLQLQHGGRRAMGENCDLVAPSPIAMEYGARVPHAMTTQEVYDLIDAFVAAAVRAQKAGFDLVEVHCAHGYLLNDFVSPRANRRTDEFGGSIAGRAKAPIEIIKGIKKACGKDFPVSVRVSADEMVEDGNKKRDSAVIAMLLEEAGADLINVSCGVNGVGKGIAPAARETGHNVEAAEQIRKVVDIKVGVAGRITEPAYAEMVLRSGSADFVTIGRPLFADPEFVLKAEEGRENEICPCVSCLLRCYGNYGHGGIFRGCMVNPFAMRETTLVPKPAEVQKNIVVVGGGPAGLETAWVAAKRGHHVTLLEKNSYVGGQFQAAAVPPHKQLIASAICYYRTMCEKYGVEIRYNTEADKELILSLKPDAVVLATGGQPLLPPIPGLKEADTLTGLQILGGVQPGGKKILVLGGGAQGAETADHLGDYGYDVTVVEMRDGIALDDPQAVREKLFERFERNGVKCMPGTTVKYIYSDGVDAEKDGEKVTLRGFDRVVMSLGVRNFNPLEEQLTGLVDQVVTVGDATRGSNAVEALYKAAVLGCEL